MLRILSTRSSASGAGACMPKNAGWVKHRMRLCVTGRGKIVGKRGPGTKEAPLRQNPRGTGMFTLLNP
jgi:hypothetical protein